MELADLEALNPYGRRFLDAVLTGAPWLPIPDSPQVDALLSPADEVYFGGSAGGGKTDLVLGVAILMHLDSIIFRREFTQLTGSTGLIERSREILDGTGARYQGTEHVWRGIPPRNSSLEFGAVQREDDKRKYRGRPHDFIAFDEIPEFTESQYRFLIGWNRTTIQDQRVRVLCTGNPPSHQEGQWVIRHWAPWLDSLYPNPAKPGELRWFATIDGEDKEVEGPEPFEHEGEIIAPRSRTFIPATLEDNPYLAETDYRAVLQSLPEPLRSQLLNGDFTAGYDLDPWQVIPTAWIKLAQQRWQEREKPDVPLSAIGCDPARGGRDKTVLSERYENWFAHLHKHPGPSTPDGPSVAALVIGIRGESEAQVYIDIIGIGSSGYDFLVENDVYVIGVNFSEGSDEYDRSGRYKMRNVRAEAYWGLREALDPNTGDDIALPPDPELLADLAAPRWKLSIAGVLVESKDDIKKRLGRSPDCGDAVVLAAYLSNVGDWAVIL